MSVQSAHAEMCAAVYIRERADVMRDVCEIFPNTSYPVSGDMLAVVKRGSAYERRQRRRRASAERRRELP